MRDALPSSGMFERFKLILGFFMLWIIVAETGYLAIVDSYTRSVKDSGNSVDDMLMFQQSSTSRITLAVRTVENDLSQSWIPMKLWGSGAMQLAALLNGLALLLCMIFTENKWIVRCSYLAAITSAIYAVVYYYLRY